MASTLPLSGDGDINQNTITPANGKYKLANATSGAGKTLTIEGSNAFSTNSAGGIIEILPGAKTGTGAQGYVIVKGPSFVSTGDQANLSLGDTNHSIRAEYGFGMKISTAGSQNAINIQENTKIVGLGSITPTAALDVYAGVSTISDSAPNMRLRGTTSTVPSGGNNGDIQIYSSLSVNKIYVKIGGSWKSAVLS